MSLPKFLQPYLPSYNLSLLKKDSPGVKKEIITQILNSGDTKAVCWLFANYPLKEIKKVVISPERGIWFENSLNYWTKIFKINIPGPAFNKAVYKTDLIKNVPQSFK